MALRNAPPTSPDCFATGPFGAGPFPPPGWEFVLGCPANPDNAGFGGVAWTTFPIPDELPAGGAFGLSPFGGVVFPQPPVPLERLVPPREGVVPFRGGERDGSGSGAGWGDMEWGGDPWGLGGSSSAGLLTGAVSLNGWEIQVFFAEGSGPSDPADYILAQVLGAAPSTVLRVRDAGLSSVVITHTGTTLGGFYNLNVNLLTGPESVGLYTKGEAPPFVVAPTDSGEDIVLTFLERMLPASEGSDIDDPAAYVFSSTPEYPIVLTPTRIDHPWQGNFAKVHMMVKGMTSLDYGCKIGPALAWDWTGNVLPDQDPTVDGRTVNPQWLTSTIADGTMWLAKPMFAVCGWEFLDKSGRLVPTATFRADVEFGTASMVCHPPLSAFPNPKLGDIVVEDGVKKVSIRLFRSQDEDWLRVWSGSYNTFVKQPWSSGASRTITVVRNDKAGIWAFLFDGTPFLSVPLAAIDGLADGDGPGVTWKFCNDWFTVEAFNLRRVKVTATSTVWSGSWNFVHEAEAEFEGVAILARDHVMTRRGPLVKDWGDATPATKSDVILRVLGVPVGISDVNPWTGKVVPEVPIPTFLPGDPLNDVKIDYCWQASPVMEMSGLNTPGLVLNQWDRLDAGRHDPPGHGQPWPAWIEGTEAKGFIPGAPPKPFPKCRTCGSDLVDLGPPFWWCDNDDFGGVPCPAWHVRHVPSWDDLDPIRFPMGTVLGPAPKVDPLFVGWRYIGFQREYSALLNSPDTLVLNRSPLASSVDEFARTVQGSAWSFNGTVKPDAADPAWTPTGTDSGWQDIGLGTWTLVDADPGPWEPDDPAVAVWSRETDLTFPAAVTSVVRFQIETPEHPFGTNPVGTNPDIFKPDGVFTGVGFGVHDNRRLWLAGALLVNGLEHAGMLKDARDSHSLDGWHVGPSVPARIVGRTTNADLALSSAVFMWATADAPADFKAGRRFQIMSGPQAGVYVASEVLRHCDGTTTATVSPACPSDPTRWGCRDAVVVFETPWSGKPSTWRLVVDVDQEVAVLSLSGATTATVVTLDGQTATVPLPAETPLVLNMSGKGQAFWGSLNSLSTSRSRWSFVQEGVVPDFSALEQGQVKVATEMDALPEDDPNNPWFVSQGFGAGRILTAGTLLLKSLPTSETIDTTFGWSRIEPFLTPDVKIDLWAQFRADSGTAAAGDAQIVVNNGSKEVRLATLVYAEGFPDAEWRRLVAMPQATMSGILDPKEQGWTLVPGSAGSSSCDEWDMTVAVGSGESRRWSGRIDASALGTLDSGWRTLEMRIAADSVVPDGSGKVGIELYSEMGPSEALGIRLDSGTVKLVNDVGVVVGTWPFAWEDGEFHSFRAVSVNGAVSLAIDDVVQVPTLPSAAFLGGSGAGTCRFGVSSPTGASSVVRWRDVAVAVVPGLLCRRTFGVWLGGDPTRINSWEIPRKDDTTAPNSAEIGPDIQDMNWSSASAEVRLLLAPDWGVTMYRPDLPLPPYYQPESGTPGTGFANQTNEPSAGWINVEWANLPLVPATFGKVSFGALERSASTRQRWNWVRYRIFAALLEDHVAPQHMVLNQAWVTTSGELTKDVGHETVVVQSLTAQSLSLLPAHVNAASVWQVIDSGTLIDRKFWTFDPATQLILLDGAKFSAENAPVEVVFIPGNPVTKTYLEGQPLLDSITLLNSGTPPVPKSQTSDATKEIVYGSLLNDPADLVGGGFVLNDPYRVLVVKDDVTSLYEGLEFVQVDNGGFAGSIAMIGEGVVGEGFSGWTNATETWDEEGRKLTDDEGDDRIYAQAGSVGCDGPGPEIPAFGHGQALCPTDEIVGRAVGAFVMDFRGSKFTENARGQMRGEPEQGGGMPNFVLHAAGGTYMGPVVDGAGMIVGRTPLGGRVGPGPTLLMPNWPSGNVVAGRDGGKARRRTEWVMSLRSVSRVTPDSVGGFDVEDVPLRETFNFWEDDNVAPSRPASWVDNPGGIPNPNGRGVVLAVMTGAGDHSRVGPWAGIGALTPTPDSGFFEIDAGVLADGDQVEIAKDPGGVSVIFTARTVPTLPREFTVAPSPHVSLANAINADATASAVVTATAGVTWTGVPSVLVESNVPVSAANMVTIWSSDTDAIWLVGTLPEPGDKGLLDGGAKLTQSSLVAGGALTVRGGVNDTKLGIVCLGGTALPTGLETVRTIWSA